MFVAAGCEDPVDTKPTTPNLGTVDDIMADLPKSCAFQCGECTEPEAPFECPTLAPWDKLPHDEACEAFDGTYPTPVQGKCTVSDASGEAAAKAGPLPGGGFVLPDGHRIDPVGREVLFEEPDLRGTFPMNIMAVPGSRLALVSDGGIRDNALRVLDLDKLASGGAPVTSYLAFPRPTALYYGLAWIGPNRALASGGGDSMVYAFDVDSVTGQATRVAARDIALGMSGDNPWYSGALAMTGDGKRLVVAPSQYATEFQVISLDDADYGKRVGGISTGGSYAIFDVRVDPFNPAGNTFYATDQSGSKLIEIEVGKNAPTRTLGLAKSPAQFVFLDETYVAVAEAHGDSIALVNRATMKVDSRAPIFDADAPRGASPSVLAYDAANKRLYAALAGINAVGVYDVGTGTPPTITPAGSISTAWWPTGVIVDADGSLVIINGKAHGTGPDTSEDLPWADGNITEQMRGSVQHVPASELANLAAHTATVDNGRHIDKLAGAPQVTCPAGTNDFPIPATNTEGPSKVIKHVILVVRENKTYDSVLGDRTDVGDGDPKLIMAPDTTMQDAVWRNARAIAGTFANFDNFYTDAEQSVQGHVWTVFGRTNDYVERSWLSSWGRGTRPPTEPTTTKQSAPEEGSIFHWMGNNGIDYDNMGEVVGNAPKGLDGKYPGLVYSGELPDTNKSCYMAGRIRLRCDLKPFTYAVQPNDHTSGGSAGAPAPEVMIAVNDEATGMLIDALSHSPSWKDTLVIITEDDPQNGADHVDLHRTVMWMVSPWVRRKYTSHGHYDMASIYKLVAHIFGLPYNNEAMRSALLPIDAFTSTPDYAPFTYFSRTVTAPCNASNTKEAKEAEAWDLSEPDEQPGLSEQVERMMRTTSKERGVRIVQPKKSPASN